MRQRLTMTTFCLICAAGYATEATRPEGMDRGGQTAAGLNLTSQVATIRDASLVGLGNRHVLVELDSASGRWNATWLGKAKAAVNGVGFSVQVNDQNLTRTAPKTTTEPFTDKLGTGTQIVELWGDSIRITRRLRLYDDQPVITISASMANTGDRDVSLGAASLVDVSEAAKGEWRLGAVDGAPGVVYVRGSADPACEPAWDAGTSAQ